MLQVLEGVEASLHAKQREPFDFAQDKQAPVHGEPVQGEPALHDDQFNASELFNEILRHDTSRLHRMYRK